MKYIVIGLGHLGKAVAENMTRIGHEVIGVDIDPMAVEAVKHTISGAVCMDSRDREALSTLPISEMDAIYILFEKDFGLSVQTTAILRSLSANHLIVRANSPIHEAVLRAIGVTEVLTPEEDFAQLYATQSLLGDPLKNWYKVTDTHHLYRVVAPYAFVGQSMRTLNLQEHFGLRLVGIERKQQGKNILGIPHSGYKLIEPITDELTIAEGDQLLLFGPIEVLHKLKEF